MQWTSAVVGITCSQAQQLGYKRVQGQLGQRLDRVARIVETAEEAVNPSGAAAEAAAREDAGIAFSDLSIEVGHVEPNSFRRGVAHLENHLRRVTPWLGPARTAWGSADSGARTSTCFLVDDYTAPIPPPSEVIPKLLKAAGQCDIAIDYLVRESAYAGCDALSLARYIESRTADGDSRAAGGPVRSVAPSAWLADGERRPSPVTADGSVNGDSEQTEPSDSIFMDIRLWPGNTSGQGWSCSFLAAVWQLARLGVVNDTSIAYGTPWEKRSLSGWNELPPVIQLNQDAAPFRAYRTVSILESRYLPIEAAVRIILKTISTEPEILNRIAARGSREDVRLPAKLTDMINYVFVGM
jgi:hypothetical protein